MTFPSQASPNIFTTTDLLRDILLAGAESAADFVLPVNVKFVLASISHCKLPCFDKPHRIQSLSSLHAYFIQATKYFLDVKVLMAKVYGQFTAVSVCITSEVLYSNSSMQVESDVSTALGFDHGV